MASMALVGLKYLEEDNTRRREICQMYEKSFQSAGIQSVKVSPYTELSSRHLYQIVVEERNKTMEFLNIRGIYPGVHYRDNTHYDMYKSQFGLNPNSLNLSEKIISLPLHLFLTDDDIEFVIQNVIESQK
jgi:dTDP-4-amino-4,6-dideoxygalactose transaminase